MYNIFVGCISQFNSDLINMEECPVVDKLKKNKHYSTACDMYKEIKDVVKVLTEISQAHASGLPLEKAMQLFDIILQGILFQVAAEDSFFVEEELQFIEKIAEYGNIMSFLSDKGWDISWEKFRANSVKNQKKLTSEMMDELSEITEEFIHEFAVIDALLGKTESFKDKSVGEYITQNMFKI